MKIALIGYGKMGRKIEILAKEKGHSVISIDPFVESSSYKSISEADLSDTDVCIDFSHPEVVMENLKSLCELKKNVVMGSTGWYDREVEVRELVASSGIGFVYASNFSLGVQLFFKIAEASAKIINRFSEYDVSCLEAHHNQKADSPSGTAHTMVNILLKEIDRKSEVLLGSPNRKVNKEELQLVSLRCGAIPGTHEIVMDSEVDTITVKHTARSRDGFASGAIKAAEWLVGKKGFYSIEDLVEALLSQ